MALFIFEEANQVTIYNFRLPDLDFGHPNI